MRFKFMIVVVGAMLSAASLAQAPSAAPAGSTGLCRDGSYWSGATKRGACSGHKGVQDWYGTSSASAAAAPTPSAAAAPAVAAPVPTATATASAASPAAGSTAPAVARTAPAAAPAPGGGAGMVWVNTSSKVYHCSTDRWYGKTKNGRYLSEADAIAQGDRADHGKACSK